MRLWRKPPLKCHRQLRCPPDPTIWFRFPCPKIRRKAEIRPHLSYIFFHFLSSVDLAFTLEIFARSREKSQKSFFDLDAHLARYLLPADVMPTSWHDSCSPPPPPPGGGGGGGEQIPCQRGWHASCCGAITIPYLETLRNSHNVPTIRGKLV